MSTRVDPTEMARRMQGTTSELVAEQIRSQYLRELLDEANWWIDTMRDEILFMNEQIAQLEAQLNER